LGGEGEKRKERELGEEGEKGGGRKTFGVKN
jgi:hypothetical protein